METLKIQKNEIEKACSLILNDEIVAIPTETVYGLGANALSPKAVEKIFIAKGRPQDNPLIVHICSKDMLEKLVLDISDKANKIIEAFWPGAITLIFKKSDIVPDEVSKGLDTVAIRFPNHKTALELIEKCNTPIAAPSANISGKPSPTSANHVFNDLNGKISAVIIDENCDIGIESTVLDVTREIPVILRPGQVTKEQIEKIIGKVFIDQAITCNIDNTKKVSSPGMKYRHYAPNSPVTIICGNENNSFLYIKQNMDEKTGVLCFDEYIKEFDENALSFGSIFDKKAQAQQLFDKLRAFDNMDITKILAQCPNDDGIGFAISNRLKKSGGFNVIEV